MGEFWVDVDHRKRRAHQAGDVNRGFAQPEYGNIEQFPQLVQAGIEDVANQESVVIFGLGAEAIFEHLGSVEEFEVAVLLGNGAVRAQPVDGNLGSRRRRPFEDPLQHLAVGTVARAARHTKALVEQTHYHLRSLLARPLSVSIGAVSGVRAAAWPRGSPSAPSPAHASSARIFAGTWRSPERSSRRR